MEILSRDEAEKIYVDWIMKSGNPAYFVWKAVREWENHDLAYHMSEAMGGDEPEIEDEE